MDDGLNALWIKLFLFSNIRAENATFNGILIGSVVMTEILVCRFDAVSGPGTREWFTSQISTRHLAVSRRRRAK
jgi:hypothetical protein